MLKQKFIHYLEKRCRMDAALKNVLKNDNIYKKQSLKRGASMLLPKMDVDEIHYLGSGLCKAFWLDEHNEEQIFMVWAEDSMVMLSEALFAGHRNNDVYIVILQNSELLSLTKIQLDMICMLHPELLQATHNIRAEQMEMRNQQLRIMMKKEGDRYGLFCKVFPELRKRLGDKDTRSFLGISRTTLGVAKQNG